MTAILAFVLFWVSPAEAAPSVVQHVICSLDERGEIVMVPDGFGGTRPDCWARKDAP